MKIFEKRPLSLILCIMLGAFSLFANFGIWIKLAIALSFAVGFGATFIFENKIPGSKILFRVSLAAAFAATLLSLIWSLVFFPSQHYDQTVEFRAKVYDIDDSSYNARVTLKTINIDGEKDVHKLLLYLDRETAQALEKYDVITFSADVRAFADDTNPFEGSGYYIADGISAFLENAQNLSIVDHEVDDIDRLVSDIRLKISNTLKKRSDFQTGAFLTALITGNREDLDGNTRLNFSRIGISHVLALSGMHLAILSMALTKLLTIVGINKKIRTGIISVFTISYMALTGFSPSVFRAGVMLLIAGMLFLLSRSFDSITSLFIAVAIIVICTPYAVFDLSLWLSAFATLGVVVFAELKREMNGSETNSKEDSKIKRVLLKLRDGVVVSLFAFGATFAISALKFGAFSILSVITTLIFSVFIEIMIYSGLLILVLGWLIPFRGPVVVISDFIKELSGFLSNQKWIYVSADSLLIKALIVTFTVFFFLFIILDTKKKKLCLIILLSMIVAIFAIGGINGAVVRHKDEIMYAPSASGDIFISKSNGNTSVIYSGKGYVSSAYDVIDTLGKEGITYIDRLVLANYSYSTQDFCNEILSKYKTDLIYVPVPLTKDEINQAEGLSDMLSLNGASLEFYNLLESIEIDEVKLCFFDREHYSYGKYPMNVFSVTLSDKSLTYISTGDYELVSVEAKALLYHTEYLFVGTGGNTKYYQFNMRLPEIKSINYAEADRLTDGATEYYSSLGAEFNYIEKPVRVDE